MFLASKLIVTHTFSGMGMHDEQDGRGSTIVEEPKTKIDQLTKENDNKTSESLV